MFGVDYSELMLVALVALVVIGPKDLPKAMRVIGYWVGKARAVGRQFRSGFDEMVREAELAEMEKKWKAENERIMREFSASDQPAAATLPDAATGEPGPVMVERPQVVPARAAGEADQPGLFAEAADHTAALPREPDPAAEPKAQS